MVEKKIGLIGAASFVGERLRSLLAESGYEITVFSRKGDNDAISLAAGLADPVGTIESWVCLAPIWTLPDNFRLLEAHRAKRVVALSSTSRFSKRESSSPAERDLATRLLEGEEQVLDWAGRKDIAVVILQPTLIYGFGKDENVAAIARFIQRFGFFPLFGGGKGRRQPVHVDDVAAACFAASQFPPGKKHTYVLSGGEVVSYRAMVERIFAALERRPFFLRCPLTLFALAVRFANLLPQYRGLTTEMAARMNTDLNFDHTEARNDLGFEPRAFHPGRSDVTV